MVTKLLEIVLIFYLGQINLLTSAQQQHHTQWNFTGGVFGE